MAFVQSTEYSHPFLLISVHVFEPELVHFYCDDALKTMTDGARKRGEESLGSGMTGPSVSNIKTNVSNIKTNVSNIKTSVSNIKTSVSNIKTKMSKSKKQRESPIRREE
jgi:hypothetical protein